MPTGGPGIPKAPSKGDVRRRQTPRHRPSANDRRKSSTGQKQQQRSAQGRARSDRPYTYGPPDLTIDMVHRPEFRFVLVKASGEMFELENVESCTWDDVNAILTGSLTLHDKVIDITNPPTVEIGDRVICQVNEGHGFTESWFMRVYRPSLAVNARQRTFELANDLDLLRQSEDDFYYSADQAHPHGWLGHEIIEDICRRYQVPIGALYTSSTRFQLKYQKNRVSPLEVIRTVVVRERRRAGRRLVTRFEGGRLYVMPLQRSPHLLRIGPALIDAALKEALPDQFATSISLHGLWQMIGGPALEQGDYGASVAGGESGRKVTVESSSGLARFGFVHRIFYSPDARTVAELRAEAKQFLAAVAKPRRLLTVTVPGIPAIRRGDAITIELGTKDIQQRVVWVTEASHSLVGGTYTTQISVVFDDPYIPRSTKIYFKLKSNHDEAVGNRERRNPDTWYLPKNNKSDVAGVADSPQSKRFNAVNSQAGLTP